MLLYLRLTAEQYIFIIHDLGSMILCHTPTRQKLKLSFYFPYIYIFYLACGYDNTIPTQFLAPYTLFRNSSTEAVFVNLLRSPGIDSKAGGLLKHYNFGLRQNYFLSTQRQERLVSNSRRKKAMKEK